MVALDLRYHKSPYSDVDGDFLGEEQWAWLAETLQSAKEDAVVVVSSLQVLDERYGLGERWGPLSRRTKAALERPRVLQEDRSSSSAATSTWPKLLKRDVAAGR